MPCIHRASLTPTLSQKGEGVDEAIICVEGPNELPD